MQAIQDAPQPVVARVHGLATAAGCQLVATCDLAVATTGARFAAPGGQGGWFCHTPMVAIGRTISRKRAMELALSGDAIDADTALTGGSSTRCAEQELDAAVAQLLAVTRGSTESKAIGKRTLYAQLSMPQQRGLRVRDDVMACTSQSSGCAGGDASFLEKRPAQFAGSS